MKKILPLLLLCACESAPFAQSMKDTYDAVAPEYQAYVEADPKLGAEEKARRFRTLAQWKAAVDQAVAK